METEQQPNEKSHELDEARKKSLSDFVKKKKFGQDVDESEEKTENSEEKLDNDQNNSYINNKDNEQSENKETEASSDDQQNEEKSTEDKYKEILEKQFSGDGKKAVKSWQEGQKEYGRLRRKYKEHEKKLNYIDRVVQENPVLEKLLRKGVEQGKVTKNDLQSFLSEDSQEPNGKPNNTSSESKLESIDEGFDVNDIDENTLAESGYINPDKKDSLSPSEWNILKRQAAVKYAEDKLPERLANQAYSKFQKQIDQEEQKRKEEKQRKKHRRINEERYEQGLDKVVEEFNLDFANNDEHEEMLDDIESLATNIRDPQNSNVIHENAIYLATMEVMKRKGINPDKSVDVDKEADKAKQQADESFDKRTGFNANTKKTGNKEPETLAEKMEQRHLSEYKKEHEKRVKTGRISSDN